MIKVYYGLSKKVLDKHYHDLFDIPTMDKEWKRIRSEISKFYSVKKIPIKIKTVLTADYPRLVEIFQTYLKWSNLPNTLIQDIKTLFNYKSYQPLIAGFFMNPKNKFQLHVCHYCGTAYINAYGILNDYKNKYFFIKNATPQELKKLIPGNLSDKTIQKIVNNRGTFTCLDDFDKMSCWRSNRKSDSIKLQTDNHFDLDHELDKDDCPLLALSLYNFVPSCQVCNEKLKRTSTIGDKNNRKELIKLSPTSDSYDFDGNVTFSVTPKRPSTYGFLKNLKKYTIEITCHDSVFEKSVSMFRLKQRYNYHKVFALRLLDLKERYSTGSIKMISNLLQTKNPKPNHYSEKQIYEDIFGVEYSAVGNRCFDKLSRDILK